MRDDQTEPSAGQSSNVIVMNRHRTDKRFVHLATVEAYWQALRGCRLAPERSEVDPRGIEASLEYAFILEKIAPGVGRLRIAGTHLADLMGMEVRGMPLSALFAAEARSDLASCLEAVCETPAIATLSLEAAAGIGKPLLEARLLLMPLRGEDGQINRVLGCLDSSGSIGRAPRRFVITAQRLMQITGHESAAGSHGPGAANPAPRPLPGLVDEVSRLRPADRTAKAPRDMQHLRLVTPDA